MSATWVIASRELRDKRRIFLTAAALAVLPFVAALLPGAKAADRPTVIAVTAGFLSVAMALGVAAVLGGTTIGRELSDGRLSFYFSKPVSAKAIWIGKGSAAILTAIGSFIIVALPSMLAIGHRWKVTWNEGPARLLLATSILAVALFLVTHAVSSMIRSRSAFIGLDFVCAAVASAALFLMFRPLISVGAWRVAIPLGYALLAATLFVLAVAPAWQLANGRVDRRRSHFALSRFLWSGMAVVLFVASGYVWWLVHPSPADVIEPAEVSQAPAGGWALVAGNSRGRADYVSSFLIAPDGDFVRIPPAWWGAAFSRDGRLAVWAQPTLFSPARSLEIYSMDLETRKVRATGIVTGRHRTALLDDGSRIAVVEDGSVRVYDLAPERLLAAARIPLEVRGTSMFFAERDVLRIYSRTEREMRILELNIATRKVSLVSKVAGNFANLAIDDSGTRMLALDVRNDESADRPRTEFPRPRSTLVLMDARSGAILSRYESGVRGSTILGDGSVALHVPGEPSRVILEGPRRLDVQVPDAQFVFVRGEIAPGKLLVTGIRKGSRDDASRWQQFIIDVNRGVIERVDVGLYGPHPVWNGTDPRRFPLDSGQPLLVVDAKGKLVRWNPATGERKPGLR